MNEQALDRAEDAVVQGRGLDGTGFWKAVARLRRDPAAARRYADRVAQIDRRAFESSVRLRVPLWAGGIVLVGGTAAGVAGLFVASRLEELPRTLTFLVGLGFIIVCTHSLVHVVVGRFVGIRFTHFFLGGPPPPRPGAKVDYASYLRTPPRRRALMHASGAVVTKLIPFAMLPAGVVLSVSTWALWAVVVVGLGQIVTDVLLSTKTSDWKKVRRELRAARSD